MVVRVLTRVYRWLRDRKRKVDRLTRWPPVGALDLGDLRRLTPISKNFGFDRGTPIDRYYMEKFLGEHAADVRGRVLEVGDPRYTRMFGHNQVTRSDVLHINLKKPDVTIIGDLTKADHIPPGAFDCLLLTQTLQFIYDFHLAVKTCHRLLKPGGVLLAAFPGISQIYRPLSLEKYEQYWRFTPRAIEEIFLAVFPAKDVLVHPYGNVLTASALLHGLAAEELAPEELDYQDPDYDVIIAVRALKGMAGP